MGDVAIMCDEVTESQGQETKTLPTNFNEKNITRFSMFSISILLLIAVSIYSYLIKFRPKN